MSLLISCAIPIVERYTGESILQKGINIFSGGCEEVFRKALEVFGKNRRKIRCPTAPPFPGHHKQTPPVRTGGVCL
jgi:hypothetical protein